MKQLRITDFELADFNSSEKVKQYVDFFSLYEAFELDVAAIHAVPETPNRNHAVDPDNHEPYPPKWGDLARLHWLVRTRRVVSAVEFGAGYSTPVIAHALRLNSEEFKDWADTNRRSEDPFTLLSVDQSNYWLEHTMTTTAMGLRRFIRPHLSDVLMGSFNGRLCTYFADLPNFVADLVYLDGPDQYAPEDRIRGFSTDSKSLMPMSGDLLAVEHFFEPGAVIVVDGRTANARFLLSNFQRNWRYAHFPEGDFHLFEQGEPALGKINQERLSVLRPLLQ